MYHCLYIEFNNLKIQSVVVNVHPLVVLKRTVDVTLSI